MNETVGERVQRIARERGLPSGEALAEALGVTYEAMRQWTRGPTAPSRKRAQVVADYLKVSVETVMHGSTVIRQPDAEALADAFDALPVDSEMALTKRRWLYQQVMAQIAEAQREARASAPAPVPAAQPTAAPPLPQ
jgi:transcriptional regulator with XRE-family HTH domain